jgi:hypothetical protein
MQDIKLAQDHPRAELHEYKGIQMRIRFGYPDKGTVPNGATITIDGSPALLNALEINEATYDAALIVAKAEAEAWIDLNPSA